MRWIGIAVRTVRGNKETGATADEYALMASLIAGFIVASVMLVGQRVVPLFQSVLAGF